MNQEEKEKKGLRTSVQRSVEAYANLLVALYSGFLNDYSLTQKSASNTLELHPTLSTDLGLGSHVYMHVSCIKKLFCLVWGKKPTVLCSCLRCSI